MQSSTYKNFKSTAPYIITVFNALNNTIHPCIEIIQQSNNNNKVPMQLWVVDINVNMLLTSNTLAPPATICYSTKYNAW